ncbi:MAG: periplasmic heavy metal sensor [Planctomycetota bacterium]
MITKASIGFTVVAALCFGGSFLGTVATRSQTTTAPASAPYSPLARQLGLNPEQAKVLEAHDPQFAEDFRALREKLEEARLTLATLFEKESATGDEIRAQVEAAIEAHNQLERRVAEYVITIRDHLTPEQQKLLYGLCAEKVRECGGRWRHGRGRHADAAEGDGSNDRSGSGQGRGGGQCQGRGQGRGCGRGQGHGSGTGGDDEGAHDGG